MRRSKLYHHKTCTDPRFTGYLCTNLKLYQHKTCRYTNCANPNCTDSIFADPNYTGLKCTEIQTASVQNLHKSKLYQDTFTRSNCAISHYTCTRLSQFHTLPEYEFCTINVHYHNWHKTPTDPKYNSKQILEIQTVLIQNLPTSKHITDIIYRDPVYTGAKYARIQLE